MVRKSANGLDAGYTRKKGHFCRILISSMIFISCRDFSNCKFATCIVISLDGKFVIYVTHFANWERSSSGEKFCDYSIRDFTDEMLCTKIIQLEQANDVMTLQVNMNIIMIRHLTSF